MPEEIIVNKVAESGIITIDLENYYPREEVAVFDIKDYLYMGLLLKEKDFRTALQQIDWSFYQDKNVAVFCSADAIVPVWAYMLITSYLQPYAKNIVHGTEQELHKTVFLRNIQQMINPDDYVDKRVVIKGCGELPIGEFAYLEITRILRPVAKSIMYGEPCSTVPVYKKKNPASRPTE
ncbi:MAG TPA: DUF2480 family protein [Parasegetibacter sp.]|jgi:hypothetical protein